MEILVWLAAWVVGNALVMALIMRQQARRLRGWHITKVEALLLQARVSLGALLCVLAVLFGLALLPDLGNRVLAGLLGAAFFVPYYLLLRRASYLLTKTQRDRGRGVARANIRQIIHASLGYLALLYLIVGGLILLILRMAGG